MTDPDSSTPNVLIIDDEKNVRLTLRQALEDQGLRVETAEDGSRGLDMIEEKSYDLALLDHRMPGQDGIEVLKRIRRIAPNIPVVIITAHGTVERAVKAVRLGAVDVLPKPVTIETLRELVGRVLRRPSPQEGTDRYDEWVQLGAWHFRYRRTGAARHCLREAISQDDSRSEAHTLLGILEANEGNPETAREHLGAALERNPEASTARLFLEHVQEGEPLPLDRPLPMPDLQISDEDTLASEQQLDVSPSSADEESKEAPHRVLAVLGEHIADRMEEGDRALIRLAASSARAHHTSELLLLTVIEVPWQVSPSQFKEVHRQKIRSLQDQLEQVAEETGTENLGVRPLVIVAHETSSVIQNIVAEESVQHLLGRIPSRTDESSEEEASYLDSLEEVPCEVTLFRPFSSALSSRPSQAESADVAAFISESPYAPFVARRALEWAQGSGVASLTLINVQAEDGGASEDDLRHRGKRLLWDAADRAGLEKSQYKGRVVTGGDIQETLARCAEEYDFVCVGASRSSSLAESIFGTVTEQLVTSVGRPFAIVRGPQPSHRSFIEDLGRRLAQA